MSSSNLVRIGYKKETQYGVTPPAVKASLVLGDITWQALLGGEQGNAFSVEYLDTVTAGNEVVTIEGNKISVAMEDGVSTATQIMAAVTTALADLTELGVGASITGTAGDAQADAVEANLAGGLGSFKTARFISEQYSGTPETTESQQIRTDRQSSGQVVTSLSVAGGHSFELAKEKALEDFMESAMMSSWESTPRVAVTLTINATAKEITRAAGSFINEGVKVGDFLKLDGFNETGNNVSVMAVKVEALKITYAGPAGMANAADGEGYQIFDKIRIGTTKKSLTVEKVFLDLTEKALIYRGCLVSQMELSIEYGSLATGSFESMGNGYESADEASEFASYGEYFDDPATTPSMNGSVDMPFIATDVTGDWDQDAFCLQNLNLTLNNNLSVQNCIGKIAPEDYSPGTAQIGVELSSYLKDTNWDMLQRKLTQESFGIGFMTKNEGGAYGFFLPAIQVSFDDPSSGGQNQEVSLEMSGTAKVGDNQESALTIYREPSV